MKDEDDEEIKYKFKKQNNLALKKHYFEFPSDKKAQFSKDKQIFGNKLIKGRIYKFKIKVEKINWDGNSFGIYFYNNKHFV
jgi:hypothetical protein